MRSLLKRGWASIREDPTFQRVLYNSGWLLSGDSVVMALTFLQGIVVARVLGAERFGILALITTFATTVSQFVDSRVWETAIRYVIGFLERGEAAKAQATVKLCYLVDSVTGVIAFGLLLLAADLAARLFIKDPAAAGLIRFYALTVLIAIPVGTSTALLRIADRFDWLAYQSASMAAVRLAGVVIVALLGATVKAILGVYLAATAFGMIVLVVLSWKVVGPLGVTRWARARLSALKGELGEITRFLLATNGSAFFKLLQRNGDVLVLGYFLMPTAVGYFRLARSVSDVMNFPVAPLYTSSYPDFARLWHQGKRGDLRRLLRKLTLSSAGLALLALILIWIGAELIIRVAVGAEYLPAADVLRWLALGTGLAVATNFGHPLLLALGRAHMSLLAIASGVVVQFGLLLGLLSRLGVEAGGIAYVGFYVVWVFIVALSSRDIWK